MCGFSFTMCKNAIVLGYSLFFFWVHMHEIPPTLNTQQTTFVHNTTLVMHEYNVSISSYVNLGAISKGGLH